MAPAAVTDEILINNKVHGDRIAEAAGTCFNLRVDQCVSRTRDGKLLGGVIYSGFTERSISLHMAGFAPKWANRDMIWACFHYPFIQLGCQKIFGQVPANKPETLELDLKLGFKIEACIKDVFPDGDLFVLSMYRDECRWLELKPRHIRDRRD